MYCLQTCKTETQGDTQHLIWEVELKHTIWVKTKTNSDDELFEVMRKHLKDIVDSTGQISFERLTYKLESHGFFLGEKKT
jgi:hypothetical protein